MLQHEQTLKTCSLKEVSHKGPQMIRFCFYEMSRIGKFIETESRYFCPGQVAQLVGVLSCYTKFGGSIPGQGTYKNQQINAYISETTNQCLSLSPSFLASLSLKSIYKN